MVQNLLHAESTDKVEILGATITEESSCDYATGRQHRDESTSKGIKETEHKSLWQQKDISQSLIHENHVQIIEGLIKNDQWILEKSNCMISASS